MSSSSHLKPGPPRGDIGGDPQHLFPDLTFTEDDRPATSKVANGNVAFVRDVLGAVFTLAIERGRGKSLADWLRPAFKLEFAGFCAGTVGGNGLLD